MSPITQVSSKHLEWNRQGFFALPQDSPETYEQRICKLQETQHRAENELSRDIVKRYYDIDPAWVPVSYSSKGLQFWEAGCLWYAEQADNSPEIQLTSSFESSSHYPWIYQKDEVLAHEYVHAVRAPLGSSQFEEIFSYLVSGDFAAGILRKAMYLLRVFLGPLFSSPKEPLILLVTLFCLALITCVEFLSSPQESSLLSFCMIVLSLFIVAQVAFYSFRLLFRWWQWWRCKKHLSALCGTSSLHVMVRLVDEEIVLFSRLSPEKISQWIDTEQHNFRWQLLHAAYCFCLH